MQSQIKINRYASERLTPTTSQSMLNRALSLSVRLGPSHQPSQIPEEGPNSSTVLRKLKKINESKETLRGRLNVLHIHEQKHEYKAFSHQQKYAFLQQKREEAELQRQERAERIRAREAEMQEAQERAKKDRMARRQSIENARKQLSKGRAQDYREVRQRRGEIEKAISASKREEVEVKRQCQQQVRQYERNQKSSVAKYRQIKVAEVREGDLQEAQLLSRAGEERTKQLEELAKLQLMMIHKQANSRRSSEKSEMRLKQMLNSKTSTASTPKLPALSPSKQSQPQLEWQQ